MGDKAPVPSTGIDRVGVKGLDKRLTRGLDKK